MPKDSRTLEPNKTYAKQSDNKIENSDEAFPIRFVAEIRKMYTSTTATVFK